MPGQPYAHDTPRWRAAVLAMLLTFMPLLGLVLTKRAAKPDTPAMQDIMLKLTQPKASLAQDKPREVQTSQAHAPRAHPRASPQQVPNEAAPSPPLVSAVTTAAPPSLASSAPAPLDLRIHPTILMADISGTYTGDAPVGQATRLSHEMSKEHKPDCLGPNAGGSLLSVLVIAYMAAKDKCN